MKITTTTQDLRDGLAKLSSLPGAKGHITSNLIKIASDMEGFTISRANPDSFIEVFVSAEIEEEGEICCDYSRLSSLTSRAGIMLAIESDPKWMHVRCGKSDYFKLANVADLNLFHAPPAPEGGHKLTLPAEDFVKSLKITLPAVASDAAKAPDAVRLGNHCGQFCAIGTDGRRAHIAQLCPPLEGVEALIPSDVAHAIVKLFGEEKGKLKLHLGENGVSASNTVAKLRGPILNGEYPRMQGLAESLKKNTTGKVRLSRELLAAAIKTAATASDPATQKVILRFIEDTVNISSECGEAARQIDVPLHTNFEGSFAAGAHYFGDLLAILPSPEITLHLAGNCLYIEDGDIYAFLALLTA